MEQASNRIQVIRLQQVMAKTLMSRSTIYSYVEQGKFPAPFKLGGTRSSGWLEADIDAWLLKCAARGGGDDA